jgi:tRNA modification GTPase
LLTVMKAPHSYTREDVVEIQAHAGTAALIAIFEQVLALGARSAEPGEFTRRAFLSGRIDLTQAEAVADLINARTEAALRAATEQVAGSLRSVLENILDTVQELQALMEAEMDFPDDAPEAFVADEAVERLFKDVVAPVENLLRRYESRRIYREGARTAIVGRPNVGKSSLLNCLLGTERAIVTPLPGTTRDLVEDAIQIRGIPVDLVDTAGLHATQDPIEVIGIGKTRSCIETADLVLLVLDASESVTEDDRRIYDDCRNKPVVVVWNKTDLLRTRNIENPLERGAWVGERQVCISALEGAGIEELKGVMLEVFESGACDIVEGGPIPNLRQQELLQKSHQFANNAMRALAERRPTELAAIDLKETAAQLGRLLGTQVEADILERVFSRFCIGK